MRESTAKKFKTAIKQEEIKEGKAYFSNVAKRLGCSEVELDSTLSEFLSLSLIQYISHAHEPDLQGHVAPTTLQWNDEYAERYFGFSL